MFKAIILALLMAPTVQAQTVESLQAQIDSIKVAQLATQIDSARADVDSVVVNRVKLSNAGISIVADTADPQWVQIDFAVGSNTGYQKATLKMAYLWLLEAYKGKPSNVAWRLRVRKDRAKDALKTLNEYF